MVSQLLNFSQFRPVYFGIVVFPIPASRVR